MPIGFSRIRIAGFKSFAEPTLVELHPGLTGIVGPNGCGKSNVVEALRWAMGESSAKSLRGGEMDDVIFAGTTHRPARNLAEVALTLESTASAFPPPFDGQSELEITRRIERNSGSTFRVNGREARARDVQTLFADLASGARSSAMVSQGRVGTLVAARPDERRAILEEAAGIGGLHSRRHEAELKLRAAEANATRAEDLRTQLTTQLANLQKQARQATRYKNLSGLIRAADQDLLALQHARAESARATARAHLATTQSAIAEATTDATALAQAATTLADSLPPLRESESQARTALERRRIASEQIGAQQAAAQATLAAARETLRRVAQDRDHAAQLQRDATGAETRLAAEAARLAEELAALPAQSEAAAAALTAATTALTAADDQTHRATSDLAALTARIQALAESLTQATARARKAEQAHAAASRDRQSLHPIDPAALAAAATALAQTQTDATAAAAAQDAADAARTQAQAAHQAARAGLHEAEPLRARLAAEVQALSEILGIHRPGAARLIDTLEVPAGLEAAIGAALGDDLDLGTDELAPRHLRPLPPFTTAPSLPQSATRLSDLITAPAPLTRALSQIGLVPEDAGTDLQPSLHPGQTLVSRAGAVWRWDGFCQHAGAPTAAAIRLQQRNRLTDLTARLGQATATHAAATATTAAAQAAERAALAQEAESRAASRAAHVALDRARVDHADLHRRADAATARIAALDAECTRLAGEHAAAEQDRAAAHATHAALPNPAQARAAMDQARATLTTARTAQSAAAAAQDALARQAAGRQFRLRAIIGERAAWSDRATDAATRAAQLATRHQQAAAAEATHAAAPARLAAAATEAAEAAQSAERHHRIQSAQLQTAETQSATAARADRAADAALAAARENALRAESTLREADHAWGTIAERILEKLGPTPDLPTPPDLSPDAEDRARRKLDRLTREREDMGPVNLRAELEAAEIESRLAAIDADRADLTEAINKLRGSIGHLNREGRERLNEVFTQVNAHFQQLFTRLFGGGRAQLGLVGSDDPLQAGLEIYAQPPGKKLATLSLLSGGEQALTALCLIFAVFRCNPAPVCVLDEVDAPLDDANIDRFCALLSDMVGQTGTRFLVVTHHHMTMARMDRLYGVTMQERGVSRLLSVDLARAAELVEPVAMAAE